MDQQNKQLSKTTSQELASVLSSASATPALITQTISSISQARLEKELRHREELEAQLVALRSSWKKVPTARTDIEKKAAEVQAWLDRLPNRPTIRQAYRENPVRITDDIILLLCWLHEQVNINAGMNEIQMEQCALSLIHNYPTLRLEDLAIIIRNAVAGKYGDVFNRIDVIVVNRWALEYWTDLNEQRVERAYARHASSKEDPTARRGSQEAEEAFQEFRAKYYSKKQL